MIYLRLLKIMFFVSVALVSSLQAKPWNVLIYVESSAGLSHAAVKNITDLLQARIGNDDADRICIQWHCLGQNGAIGDEAYRYEVHGSALELKEYARLSYDACQDVVDAARWAFDGAQDAHTMIVFWDHGSGVLNLTWQQMGTEFDWFPEYDVLMDESCLFKRSNNVCKRRRTHQSQEKRGLLFMKEPKVYMSVQQLGAALRAVSTDILRGRKIDVVGMDMCMMAMVEIGYEMAPYVRYMVGSQDCELEYGWDYAQVFKKLGEPIEVVKTVVDAYDHFYTMHAKRGTYTQVALDLAYVNALKNNIDAVSAHMLTLMDRYELDVFKDMRKQLPKFCLIPMYTDLYTLYTALEDMLPTCINYQHADQLRALVHDGKQCIENMVLARCYGDQRPYARGISIYFPLSHIDSSYAECLFAQQSRWSAVLARIVA